MRKYSPSFERAPYVTIYQESEQADQEVIIFTDAQDANFILKNSKSNRNLYKIDQTWKRHKKTQR